MVTIVIGLLLIKADRLFDSRYSVSKYWVLVPAGLGSFLWFISTSQMPQMMAVPLMIQTAVLCVWRRKRLRTLMSNFMSAFLVSASIWWISILIMSSAPILEPVILITSVVSGAITVFPLIVIGRTVRDQVTGSRVLRGFCYGTLTPGLIVAVFFLILGALIRECFVVLLYLSICTLPFCALILWVPWARDTVTQSFYKPPKIPKSIPADTALTD